MPETSKAEWERALKMDERSLEKIRRDIETLRDGGEVENLTLENALKVEKGLEQVIRNKKQLIAKLARSEFEGNPVTAYEDALIADRMTDRLATVYHSSPGALRKYLREHPNADKSKHQVSTKHKPKARPQRERGYEVGRAKNDVERFQRNLDEDTKALESAKDDKERAEIQRDIDSGKKNLEQAKARMESADSEHSKHKKKQATEVTAFEDALATERIAIRFAASKAFIGEVGRTLYAIKIDGVDSSFVQQPMGRQIEDLQKVKEWQSDAKKDWISTKPRKGQKPMPELKRWLKAVNPSEFYAKWDLSVDDDARQIFYKK